LFADRLVPTDYFDACRQCHFDNDLTLLGSAKSKRFQIHQLILGLLIAVGPALLGGGIKMPIFLDKEAQARLLREIQELYEKRGRIEAEIRALEAKSKLQIEKAALQEIDAYKNLNRTRPQPS
jgi:hypothetical protein